MACNLSTDLKVLVSVELNRICTGVAFLPSRKSCDFLRFIVERTLEGHTDLLKERIIGMELLGRSSSYDTGSDSVVRVRANEVRRRLRLHYAHPTSRGPVKIEVPTGSYVPKFLFEAPEQDPPLASPAQLAAPASDPAEPASFPVSSWLLSVPTLIALFLCAICIRWHFATANPSETFWKSLLAGRTEMVIDEQLPKVAGERSPPREDFHVLSPLLSLAGKYGVTAILKAPGDRARVDSSALFIVIAIAGNESVRSALSIQCGEPCRLTIRGENRQAIEAAVDALSSPQDFPPGLASQLGAFHTWRNVHAGAPFRYVIPPSASGRAVHPHDVSEE